MPSVAVVEDHLLLAETLRLALTAQGIDTVIAAPGAPALLADALRALDPTLVLLDLDLGEYGDSTPLIAPLTSAGIRVLVVSGTTERERIALAFEAGAFGYHSKADGFEALVAKTAAALDSCEPLDELLRRTLRDELGAARVARSAAMQPFDRLTERERATLLALSTGLSVHGIARQWVVSEATVRSHVRAVLTKLDVPSQLAAVALALRNGWLSTVA